MEPWRKLMEEGAFQQARDALDEAERDARVQMAEGLRALEQGLEQARRNYEKAERGFLADLEQARAEIAEAEQAHGGRPGGKSAHGDPDRPEPWRDLMNAGKFDDARRAVDEAARRSRADIERQLRRFENGFEKAMREFGKAEREFRAAREEVEADLQKTQRDFERMTNDADASFERARAEIAEREQAHRETPARD